MSSICAGKSCLADTDLNSVIQSVNFTSQQQRRLHTLFCQCGDQCCTLAQTLECDLRHRKGMSCYYHLLNKQAKHFIGVFPADQLPPHQKEPMSFIVNSDPASQPGQHRMAYYQDADTCEFFDSYGFHPSHYPTIYQ